MIVQTLCQVRARGKIENPAVINDAGADIAAAERNDPAPPAVAHEVVRRPLPTGTAGVCHHGKFFAKFTTVPFLHACETRPHCVDRMVEVRPKVSELPRNDGGATARIDDPTCANCALLALKIEPHNLFAALMQFQRCDFRWPD